MPTPDEQLVSAADIEQARARIHAAVHRTPLLTNQSIDDAASAAIANAPNLRLPSDVRVRLHLAFKAEHLQKGGAFKARGATNAVLTHLERERAAAGAGASFDPKKIWFVTHSSGNHAGALARAAQVAGASAAVVMPLSTPAPKQAAVRGYGARAIMCESTLAARESTAEQVIKDLQSEVGDQGKVIFVHPYDNPLVIAGQGTLGEIVEQGRVLAQAGWGSAKSDTNGRAPKCSAAYTPSSSADDAQGQNEPPFDLVLSPLGGGGQLSGLSTAVKAMDARIHVYGVEPEEADDAARTLAAGTLQPAVSPPRSIADGLLTALSPRTYAHIKANVTGILTTSEHSILRALQLTWERTKQMVEPSACVGLGAVLQCKPEWVSAVQSVVERKLAAQQSLQLQDNSAARTVDVRVCIVWTGGNVELGKVVKALEGLPPSPAS